jgi:hypothetical protein
MQIRYLFVLVTFLSTSLLMGSSLMAQQNLDTTHMQDTSSMISSIDSVYADSIKRASDSLSLLAKKKGGYRYNLVSKTNDAPLFAHANKAVL